MYIILLNNKIFALEKLEISADQYPSPTFTIIDYDVEESGAIPAQYLPGVENQQDFVDSRNYAAKRRSGYKNSVDPLYFSYVAGVKIDGDPDDETNAAKTAWINARAAIKTKYPKP